MFDELLQWDRDALIFLNNLGTDSWNSFWMTVTSITTWIPLFLFLIILVVWLNGRKHGIRMVASALSMVVIVLLVTKLTKELVTRLRPNNDENVNQFIRILKSPVDYSFFSGHAASSFAIAVLLYLFLRKNTPWIGLLFIWAFMFTISRIFVGVHFPSDVLVGALVGTLFAFTFFNLHKKFTKPDLR